MSLFYALASCIFHIHMGAVYVAVKVAECGLPGGFLELLGPQSGPLLAHEPLKLKGLLHVVSAF